MFQVLSLRKKSLVFPKNTRNFSKKCFHGGFGTPRTALFDETEPLFDGSVPLSGGVLHLFEGTIAIPRPDREGGLRHRSNAPITSPEP